MLNINIGRIRDLYSDVNTEVDDELIDLVRSNVEYFVGRLNSNLTRFMIEDLEIDWIYRIIDNLHDQIYRRIMVSDLSNMEEKRIALDLIDEYLNHDIVQVAEGVRDEVRDEVQEESIIEVDDIEQDDLREQFDELIEIIRRYAQDRRNDVKSNVREILMPELVKWFSSWIRSTTVNPSGVYDQVVVDVIHKIDEDVSEIVTYTDYNDRLLEYMDNYPTMLGDRLVEVYSRSRGLGSPVSVDSYITHHYRDKLPKQYLNRLPHALLALYSQLLILGTPNNLIISDSSTSHDRLAQRLEKLTRSDEDRVGDHMEDYI